MHEFTNSVRTEFTRGHSAAVKIPRAAAPEVLHQPPKRPAHGMESGETNLTARNCGHVCLGEKFVEFLYRAVTDVAAAHGPGAR